VEEDAWAPASRLARRLGATLPPVKNKENCGTISVRTDENAKRRFYLWE